MGLMVSVELAGGEEVLLFMILKTPSLSVIWVSGVPSMNQLISVSGRLNFVMFTVKVSSVPVATSMSLAAVRTGPTMKVE